MKLFLRIVGGLGLAIVSAILVGELFVRIKGIDLGPFQPLMVIQAVIKLVQVGTNQEALIVLNVRFAPVLIPLVWPLWVLALK